MLNPITAWLGTLVGRLCVGGGIVASYFAWLYIHDLKVWNKAEVATVQKINVAGKKSNAKGLKARARVSSIDDPAGRLLNSFCRDCE